MSSAAWKYALELAEAADDVCSSRPEALHADETTATRWYASKLSPSPLSWVLDATEMARRGAGCVVLQSDNEGSGKRYQLARIDNYLFRVTRSREERKRGGHGTAHEYEYEKYSRTVNGDCHLYTDVEAFMIVKLPFDFDCKGCCTHDQLREAVPVILDAVCDAIAEHFRALTASTLRRWIAVHVCEGDKPSIHAMLLRGPYAPGIDQWRHFLIAKVLPRLPESVRPFLDLSVYSTGAFRAEGMTKKGHDRYMREVPDEALSGSDALALARDEPLRYRALLVTCVVHHDDLADTTLCLQYHHSTATTKSTKGLTSARKSGVRSTLGRDSEYTQADVLARVDALFPHCCHGSARRIDAVWTNGFRDYDVMITYRDAKQSVKCVIAGRCHTHSTNRAFALLNTTTGVVGYGCHNRLCRQSQEARPRLGNVYPPPPFVERN